MEAFGAGLVGADVVCRPADAEVLAPGGERADEVGEVAVARIAAGLGAQHRDGVVGDAVPVEEEALGARVEEDEPGVVGRPAGREVHLRVDGVAEPVGREDVQPGVLHEGRRAGHRVEDALHAGPDALLGRAAARARHRPGGTGEVEQVHALGLVEPEPTGERVEHAVGDAAQVAALHLRVVVDAHAGEHGGLLAAQARDAPRIAEHREPGLLRRDPRSARAEELADVVLGLHATRVDEAEPLWEVLPVPGSSGTLRSREPVVQ